MDCWTTFGSDMYYIFMVDVYYLVDVHLMTPISDWRLYKIAQDRSQQRRCIQLLFTSRSWITVSLHIYLFYLSEPYFKGLISHCYIISIFFLFFIYCANLVRQLGVIYIFVWLYFDTGLSQQPQLIKIHYLINRFVILA